MLFYIGFIAALGLSAYMLGNWIWQGKSGQTGREPLVRVLLIMALADTCILYLPYFVYASSIKDESGAPWWLMPPFVVIRLLQTASMDADYETALTLMTQPFLDATGLRIEFLELYSTVLMYVSVLVPFTGVLTALSFFSNKLRYFFLTGPFDTSGEIYVFNVVNERSLTLAESLLSEKNTRKGKPHLIFANLSDDPTGELADQLQGLKAAVTSSAPATVLRTVRKKYGVPMLRFVFLDDPDQNLEDALNVLGVVDKLAKGNQITQGIWDRSDRVQIHLVIQENAAANILDAQPKYGVSVQMVDEEKMNMLDLYLHRPLYAGVREDNGRKQLRLLIIGGSKTSHEAMYNCVWLGQISDTDYYARYMGKDADRFRDEMKRTAPGLFDSEIGGGYEYQLGFLAGDPEQQLAEKDMDADYIIVATDNDEKNIEIGMNLRTLHARKDPDRDPFIAVFVKNSKKAEKLELLTVQESSEKYDLYPFGMESRIFTKEELLDSRLGRMILAIQTSYHIGENEADEKDAVKLARNELNESVYNYRSTEANALYADTRLFDSGAAAHVLGKERVAGLDAALLIQDLFYPSDGETEKAEEALSQLLKCYDQQIQDEEVLERLAETEHRRWNAYMAACGWITMTPDEMRTWMEANNGGHKNYKALKHACLTTWEGLDEISSIKTGGKNPAKYKDSDRNMVRDASGFMSAGQ